MEKIERTLGDVQEDLSRDPPPSEDKPKKVKKVAKAAKKVKKVAKKASKPDKGIDDGKVTLAELCSEAEITTAAARRKLRGADLNREGRWAWEPGSKALKEARKVLGLDG